MASVSLKQVCKTFGRTEVVHGVDVAIDDGEFVVLVGPSGCGKSTLLRMIAGLEEITAGEIHIGDLLVNNVAPKQRDIAMVFQNYALYPHMTVFENMAFSMKLAGRGKREQRQRVDEAARVLGLEAYLDRYPRQLSGGQRQRVAMGRAIVRTSVYVTHDQIEAMTMADKIVVMNGGNVEQIGSPLELYDFPANLFVAGFIGSPAMNFLDGTLVTTSAGRGVRVAPDCIVSIESTREPDGRQVVLGVRPEHLMIKESQSPGMAANDVAGIEAEVIVTEPTGADTQIFCRVAGKEVVAISRQRHLFPPATRIRLEAQSGKTCLFDSDTGQRL
jgi:multiple sugar transport system ATP-binding protein